MQISRDCQELEPSIGEQLASLLYLEPDSELMVYLFYKFSFSFILGEVDQEALDQFRENENEMERKNDALCHCLFLFWQSNPVTF